LDVEAIFTTLPRRRLIKIMQKETSNKIKAFAAEWLQKTGRESLTETLQGFDFVEDCYRDLSESEKSQISVTEFLDKLQLQIAIDF
jgi:hypothetical protein